MSWSTMVSCLFFVVVKCSLCTSRCLKQPGPNAGVRLLCWVIWFINRLISVSSVSIRITLLHVRRFIPVFVIRIHFMCQVIWFITSSTWSLVQVCQLYLLINRDAIHNLLISIIHSPRVVRILLTEIIVVPE
ncbi:hypothetical protein Hanom_Chr08g00754101 [Helianthus anomalus]